MVPGGIAPISILAESADWTPDGESAASIATEFVLIREGKGSVPTNRAAQRAVNTWYEKQRGHVSESPPISLTDLEQKVIGEFTEENGAPAGLAAQNLGVSTGTLTKIAKKLQAEGLLEDTGYAMKYIKRYDQWDWIDKPKTQGGMVSKPGASTVWRATLRGHGAIGHEPSPYVTWKP